MYSKYGRISSKETARFYKTIPFNQGQAYFFDDYNDLRQGESLRRQAWPFDHVGKYKENLLAWPTVALSNNYFRHRPPNDFLKV